MFNTYDEDKGNKSCECQDEGYKSKK